MDNTTPNQAPMPNQNMKQNQVPSFTPPPKPRSPATMVITILLVLVAIIAALYFWGRTITENGMETDTTVEENKALSTSHNEADIESDLKATDVENSDKELTNIEAAF